MKLALHEVKININVSADATLKIPFKYTIFFIMNLKIIKKTIVLKIDYYFVTFSSLIFCSKHSTWATNEQAKSFQWALWVFAKIFACKVLHLRVRAVNFFADILCQHSVAKSFYPVHMGPAWTLRFFTRKGSNGDSHKTLSLYYYYFFLSVLFLVDTVWQKDIYYQKGFFNLIGTFYYKI